MKALAKLDAKMKIVEIFKEQVQGKAPDVSAANNNHEGKIGHWLEKQFGLNPNANNGADIFGLSLRQILRTTFEDWSANRYIYKEKNMSIFLEKVKLSIKETNF